MNQPVIAVVPNYNMAPSLEDLLPQLTSDEQGYDEVVVLDDASTDYSADVARGHNAWLVMNQENAGPAGNRNRILDLVEQRKWGDAILHFVDADTSLRSTHNAARAQEVFSNRDVGMAGGLILNPDYTQMAFNYGPAFTLKQGVGALVQLKVAETAKTNPEQAAKWRQRLGFLLNAWPDTQRPEQLASPIWVAEGNMLIPTQVLQRAGGFPNVRFHEAQGLGLEVARAGLQTRYVPDIAVQHHEGGSHPNRTHEQFDATVKLARAYGVARFVLGGDRSV